MKTAIEGILIAVALGAAFAALFLLPHLPLWFIGVWWLVGPAIGIALAVVRRYR